MELINDLKRLGLNQSECAVYLFLLQNGESSPPTVSRETKIARTNCYHLLNGLEQKGLIEIKEHEGRKAYRARNPESLLGMLDVQRRAAMAILPDLESLFRSHKKKPVVSFYNGPDEIRELLKLTMQSTSVRVVGTPAFPDNETTAIFAVYRDELQKRQISFEDLSLPSVSRETVPISIMIWDGHVALISRQDSMFATVIKNQSIAETFIILFNVLKRM